MGRKLGFLVFSMVIAFLLTGTGWAISIGDLGKEITVNDMIPSYQTGLGQANEDDEVSATAGPGKCGTSRGFSGTLRLQPCRW